MGRDDAAPRGSFLLLVWFAGCSSRSGKPPGTAFGHLHHPRYGAAAVTDGRYIYVLGGCDTSFRNVPAERIDTATGTVEVLPWNLLQRRYHGAVLLQGDIWLFGGENARDRIPPVERIHLADGTVSRAGQLQVPRSATDAVAWKGQILLAGGLGPADEQLGQGAAVELFSPATGTSRPGPSLPVSVETSLAVAAGQLHAVGGWEPTGGAIRGHFRLGASGRWERLPDLPWLLSANALVGTAEHLYSFGDYTDPDRVARCDLRSRRWTRIEAAYTRRRHATAVIVGENVYVIGGNVASRGSAFDLIEVFSLAGLAGAAPAP